MRHKQDRKILLNSETKKINKWKSGKNEKEMQKDIKKKMARNKEEETSRPKARCGQRYPCPALKFS